MNSHCRSVLSPCYAWAFLILLAGILISCTPSPPPPVSPPLSTIRVVMDNDYPPYVFQDETGEIRGILVDQWRLWEERTGVKVDLSTLPWGEALQRMQAGEFDVIDTIFYTGARAEIYDFTAPYVRIDVPIFFRNNISGIADAGDLTGFRVAVKSGDNNAEYLISQGITDLVYYDSYEEIVKAAARREQSIFVIDQPPALYFLYKYGVQDQFNQSAPFRSEEFHRAVKKGNAAILNLVTDGFSRISQTEYQAIDRRWLGTSTANSFQRLVPYLETGAVIALLIVIVLIIFSRVLQNRIRQRTRELEETLDALHESRRFLADLIEYSGALVFVKDLEGRYELINRQWEEVTGLKRAEVIGKTDAVLFPGPIGQQFRANDLKVIESGTVLEMEELLRDDRGQRFFISIKFPLYDETGSIKGTCGMTTEITERKRAEEALRQSEDRFSLAFRTSPDSVNINRLQDGLYLEINQGFTALTGYTGQDVRDKTSLDINIWANPGDRARLVQELREHGEVSNLEAPFRMKDGRMKIGLMSARIIEVGGETCVLSITRDITERKQAEEALRESEEKFRAIIEQASEGFALVDEDGILIECNRAQERIWGLTREEVLGRSVYDVQFQIMTPGRRTPERYAFLQETTLEALRTGQSPIFDRVVEGEFYRPDGQHVFAQQSIFPIKTRRGYRLGAISLDITERKRTEAALQASEQRMRAIVEAAPYGAHLYELEPNGRLVFKGFNPSADQILHVDHRQFIGRTIEEAFPPLAATEIPAAYRHVAATGERYQLDQIAYDDSGIRGAYELHAFQIGPHQMAVFFRDITERKQMEEALRISLEKYRVLFEAFPLGISITDSAGKILESNLQAEQLLGVPKQEHERRTYDAPEWNMIRSDGTPMPVEEYAATRALRENRLIPNIEMGVVKDQGTITWLSVTAAPIPLKGYGVAIAYGDITRHKEIEDEIRRLNEDLEQRVVDRTRELAEANARLTELDHLKSKFVSDVSHELRTPIANLKLYVDLLERGKPEKQSQYITVLQQQVRRVMALVDDILDLSRLERRKEQGMTDQMVALNDVVEQVVLAHQPRAEADGLALTFVPALDLPPVSGDANQLAQVITNLVANALSYTVAGYVRVSTYSQDNGICLCVEDSGSGISAEDLPHIFERFYRGQLVLKNDVPGTGLGLAIVKEIVDLHRGHLEVDSRLGHGSTFRAWLPVAQDT